MREFKESVSGHEPDRATAAGTYSDLDEPVSRPDGYAGDRPPAREQHDLS
jgi:hypothetical protein